MLKWLPILFLMMGCAGVNRGRLVASNVPPSPLDPPQVALSFVASSAGILPPPTIPSSVTIVDWELMQWQESDPSAVSFSLYYSFATPTGYDHVITGITDLSCVVSNLVPGLTYYMAATAVDTNGDESDFSNQYVFTMPTTLEIGFQFDSSAGAGGTNVSVQSSTNLLTWQPANARPRTNGLWRVDVDPTYPVLYFRGVQGVAPTL